MKYRALVFDDESSILRILQQSLQQKGYEVFCFSEPLKCSLTSLDECSCKDNCTHSDFILCDLEMPNMTGIQMIKKLKSINCKVKNYAILSGSWEDGNIQEARDLGCEVFFKPFDMTDLFAWLDEREKTIPPDRKLVDFE